MSNCKVKLLIVRTIKLTQHVLFILDKPRVHPGSPWITEGPLLLASFGSRCRPTRVPKMSGKCAAVHHGRRCFVSEEQRGDIRTQFRCAGLWCVWLYQSLREAKGLAGLSLWLQVVERDTWAHCLLTEWPALRAFTRADLKQRFGMVVKSGCLQGTLHGLPVTTSKLPPTTGDPQP